MDSTSTVELRGCRLAFDVRGAGPPVLFIQGVGVHGDGWLPQVDELHARFQCVTFDNRGMGRSVPTGAPISVRQMADDALAVMDASRCESAHVVGHSLGGPVAVQLALAIRDRIRSLALLCTFARGKDAAPLSWRMVSAGMRIQFGTRRVRRRAFLELVLPPAELKACDRDAVAAELAPLFGHDLGDQPPVVAEQLRAMRRYDATPRLAELNGIPTLVANAEFDPIAPPQLGRALTDGIAGARFVELQNASHGVPIRDPRRVNQLLAEHLDAAEAAWGKKRV